MPKLTRSIDKALELTPEATAFIRGDSSSEALTTEHDQSTSHATRAVKPERLRRNRATPSRRSPQESNCTAQPTRPSTHTALPAGILVPVTTRLSLQTADALRRACLEQKLQRKSPSTQQEIVEVAIRAWLADNRYPADRRSAILLPDDE